MKKEIVLIMMLVLASVGLAYVGTVNTFVGEENPFNITWFQKGNITTYIEFPMYAAYFNLTLTIHGLNYTNYTERERGNHHEKSGLWQSSSQLDNGNYFEGGSFTAGYCVYGAPCEAYNSFDVSDQTKDYQATGGLLTVYFGNGTQGNGAPDVYTTNSTVNYTLPGVCWNGSHVKIIIHHYSANERWRLGCENVVTLGHEYMENHHTAFFVYEMDMSFNFRSTLNDTKLYLADKIQWNDTGTFNHSNTTDLDITVVNEILEYNCSCVDCIISDINCRVPLNFYSNHQGKMMINLTNLTYAYGFDQCNNSFGIDSNATALNVTFIPYEGGSLPAFGSTFFYGPTTSYGENYSLSKSGQNDGFEMCIYPNWGTLYTGGIIDFNNQTYNIYQLPLTNITQYIQLETQPLGEVTIVEFTVLDYSSTPVENAYIQIQKWDVNDNSYETTEIIITNQEGVAYGNIVLATEYYRFIVIYEGDVKLIDPETGGIKMYVGSKTFIIAIDDTEWYENYETVNDIMTNFAFNESGTNYFTFEWINPTGGGVTGCMEVVKRNSSGGFTQYDYCETSAGAELTYQVTALSCGSYVASAYFDFSGDIYIVEGSPISIDYSCEYDFRDVKAGDLDPVFFAFLLILALAFIGIPFPELSFILLVVGLIVVSILKLWIVAPATIGAIIVVGLIYLYKGSKK